MRLIVVLMLSLVACGGERGSRSALAMDSTLAAHLITLPPESLAARRARADSSAKLRIRERDAARRADILARAKALCPHEYMPRHVSALVRAHPAWTSDALAAVGCGRIAIGLTAEQVRTSWHEPDHINRTVSASGTDEQWVYGGYYLYFDNGILRSWQELQ